MTSTTNPDATFITSMLVDGNVRSTAQGMLVGAVDELPAVGTNGLTKGTVLYLRTDRKPYRYTGSAWVEEEPDIADSALSATSTRPVQTKVVYDLKTDVYTKLDEMEEEMAGQKGFSFSGTVGGWGNSDLPLFPYRGYVLNADVSASDSATVVFSADDAISGDYAPICDTADGRVYVYSRTKGSPDVVVVVQKG